MWPIIVAAVLIAGCLRREEQASDSHPRNTSSTPRSPSTSSLRDENKTSLREGVLNQFQRSQYVFIGEDHAVNDEANFAALMPDLYRAGVRNLAIEVGTDEQAGVDEFVNIGRVNPNLLPNHSEMMSWPSVQRLFRSAGQAGMHVVAVDKNASFRGTPIQREQYIAEQLMGLGNAGKTLIWIGAYHAMTRQEPYPSARTLLQGAGYSTSTTILESSTSLRFYRRFHLDVASQAFQTYFNRQGPSTSFIYPANQIPLSVPLTISLGRGRSETHLQVPYSELTNFVGFLSTQDGGDGDRSPRWEF